MPYPLKQYSACDAACYYVEHIMHLHHGLVYDAGHPPSPPYLLFYCILFESECFGETFSGCTVDCNGAIGLPRSSGVTLLFSAAVAGFLVAATGMVL